MYTYMYMYMYMKKSHVQCQKKEGANPGQLFQAFGPHQQGAAQSLPGTAGLKKRKERKKERKSGSP